MLNPKEMTGLAIMQAFAQGLFPKPPISDTVPMVFHATANKSHTNPLGGVHGGFAATVLDSVTGCATHTILEVGEGYGTTDLNVKMCRPIPFNQTLIAEGKVINIGRNLVISEGYIRDENGKIYAFATATNMIIR